MEEIQSEPVNYKPTKTLAQQVDYLESDKKVVYNVISKEEAKEILYTHSYINVITPFKNRFAECDPKTGDPIRKDNKHVYPRKVEFDEYYSCYQDERKKYSNIFQNLMKFETAFNSILSYEVEQFYKLDNPDRFKAFFDDLYKNSTYYSSKEYLKKYPAGKNVALRMQERIKEFPNNLEDVKSIYIFLDRLMLNDLITVFRCCDKQVRSKIFRSLLDRNLSFGYKTVDSFNIFLSKYAQIRNYVCHFSSLEVLINYKDFKNKTPRHKSQRDSYIKAIAKLSEKEE